MDLWQIHEVIYENDHDLHFAKGGVVEALDDAKKQGKVRFVGFTGHKSPAIHLRMLANEYPFDAVRYRLIVLTQPIGALSSKCCPSFSAAALQLSA